MALAPRPGTGRSAAEADRQTARNPEVKKAQRQARREMMEPPNPNLGSSGIAKNIGKWPSFDWSTVEGKVQHISDFEGKITQGQMTSFGYFALGMHLPTAAAHAAIEAMIRSKGGMVYMRMYWVDEQIYIDEMRRQIALEEPPPGVMTEREMDAHGK